MASKILGLKTLDELCEYVQDLLARRAKRTLSDEAPCSFEDTQDQIRAVMRFMELCESDKKKGDYWTALARLHAVLGYYRSSRDLGKCGHVLLEMADCLFSWNEIPASVACCYRAISLLMESKDEHDWARGMGATGELLLVAVKLNTSGDKQAVEAMRVLRRTLPPRDRRILSTEDAHRVSRRLIAASKTGTDEPLKELEAMHPRRKRTEEKNLRTLLDEWAARYDAVKSIVTKISG